MSLNHQRSCVWQAWCHASLLVFLRYVSVFGALTASPKTRGRAPAATQDLPFSAQVRTLVVQGGPG